MYAGAGPCYQGLQGFSGGAGAAPGRPGDGGWAPHAGAAPPPTDAVLNRISQEYAYGDLALATEQFSAASRLGEGTYGTVFRGTLRDGTEVAIKALESPKEGGFREEVEVLSRFRHPNLVILLGFARNGRERYLVYELLLGGDLYGRLTKDSTFAWKQRLSVALDAALGLSHLHGSRPQVFHRDVKTQNILLDRNGTGKVADFGLACLAQPNQRSLMVSQTSGTIGYADPLYIRTGIVTERSEVYSMGMVLLECITARPPALQHPNGRIDYQYDHLGSDAATALARLAPMVDSRAQWPLPIVERLGALALSCISDRESSRPTFVEIVTQLRSWLRDESLHGSAPAAAASSQAAPAVPVARGNGGCGGAGGAAVAGGAMAAAAAAYAQPQQQAPWPQMAQQQPQPQPQQQQQQQQQHAQLQQQQQQQQQQRRSSQATNPFDVHPQERQHDMLGAAAGAVGRFPQQPQAQPMAQQQPHMQPQTHLHPHLHQNFGQQQMQQPAAGGYERAMPPVARGAPQPRHFDPVVGSGRPTSSDVAARGSSEADLAAWRAAEEPMPPPSGPPPPDRTEEIAQVVSLGFERHQAVEAFKRCSTVEAAVNYILETYG